LIEPDTVVEDGDRIEIYRALKADPKVVRRQRAKEGRAKRK
jgi:putative ubiquitin-RnfH superfamily antitoxin RatB of RatAB toxin-antitoxin module